MSSNNFIKDEKQINKAGPILGLIGGILYALGSGSILVMLILYPPNPIDIALIISLIIGIVASIGGILGLKGKKVGSIIVVIIGTLLFVDTFILDMEFIADVEYLFIFDVLRFIGYVIVFLLIIGGILGLTLPTGTRDIKGDKGADLKNKIIEASQTYTSINFKKLAKILGCNDKLLLNTITKMVSSKELSATIEFPIIIFKKNI